LLRLSGCQAAAAVGFSAFSAGCCRCRRRLLQQLHQCRKRENLQSKEREKFTNGKLRVHTCSRTHAQMPPPDPQQQHTFPNPTNAVSFVISGCFIQFRGKQNSAKIKK